MIHVVADLQIKSGNREKYLEAFNALVPEVLAEDGCISYGPTIDIDSGLDVQPPLNHDLVTVIEQWESVEHLQAHLAAPHMAEFFNGPAGQLIESISVRVTQPA